MVPFDCGTVVQVGSTLAHRGIPLQSAYCGAKHAVQGFTESVRCELLHDKSAVRITMLQMPAVNTPQFTWLRTHLPRHAQPVPPIHQPEVALTLLAKAVVPGLLDRYLARTGFDSQQTDVHPRPEGHGHLLAPADEKADYGAHGVFDDQAYTFDPQVWASRHHMGKAVADAGLVGAGYALLRGRGRR
ncbi:SDR family NAD(P)-dependent oxidoreductase [Streptomyces chartreusis]